jgi:alpha-beta hydrolase superfamily lysophospholipase
VTEAQNASGQMKAADGLEPFWRGWIPEAPAAVLLFVHGLSEHSGRYIRTASHFAGRGLACYAPDLRGHGSSQGLRVHVNRFDDYLADVGAGLSLLQERYAGLPIFLLGHSMGGLIVIRYVLAQPAAVKGAVVSSPLLGFNPEADASAVMKFAARALSVLAPRTLVSSGLDPNTLCHDKEVVDAYIKDPLVSRKVSARWYVEVSAAMADAFTHAGSLQVPMLLMQSGADRLVDPEATRRWARAAPERLVRFVWWDGFFHEMLNEPERAQVLARVDAWLEEQLASRR